MMRENSDALLEGESTKPNASTSSTPQTFLSVETPSCSQNKTKANLFYSFIGKPHSHQSAHPNQRPKLFETINMPLSTSQAIPQLTPPLLQQTPPQAVSTPKFRECYLDLLIKAANDLLSTSTITMDYLTAPTLPHKHGDISYSTSYEDELPSFSKKCENPICAVVVEDYQTQLTKATFEGAKAKSILLCEKCYNAWSIGQYCFYCNVIYRDFAFNQQYYDKNKWIQCDFCTKWAHVQCEEKKGAYAQLDELNQNKDFKYKCPFCRGEDKVGGNKKKQQGIRSGTEMFLKRKKNRGVRRKGR